MTADYDHSDDDDDGDDYVMTTTYTIILVYLMPHVEAHIMLYVLLYIKSILIGGVKCDFFLKVLLKCYQTHKITSNSMHFLW